MIKTRNLFLSIGLTVLGVVGVPAAAAEAQTARKKPKIDHALEEALRSGAATQQVIITLKPGHRARMRKHLEDHGDVVRSEHASIDALVVDLHSVDVRELAERDDVAFVTFDSDVYNDAAAPRQANRNSKTSVPAVNTVPGTSLTSTLRQTLGLPKVAIGSTLTGSAIGVAILDSGITPSANFNITGFYNFVKGRAGKSVAAFDDYGHGTHVAGLIGSKGVLSNYAFQGIAPDVRLIGLKVLDGTGVGKTSDVIKALEFVVANRSRLNIHVVNLSLGHPIYSPAADDPLVQAVQKATAAGLIVVTSAGNKGINETTGLPGYGGVSSPCNAPSAICVGATNTLNTVQRGDDTVAPYSGRGPSWYDGFAKPDAVAPGNKLAADANTSSYLYKTLPASRAVSLNGQPLLVLSGTSMAAGVATGVAALVLDAHKHNGFANQKPLSANLVKAHAPGTRRFP